MQRIKSNWRLVYTFYTTMETLFTVPIDAHLITSKLRDHGSNGLYGEWKRNNSIENAAYCLQYDSICRGLRVYYIAAQHTIDPHSRTYELISEIVPKCDICTIEGVPFARGLCPQLRWNSPEDGGEGRYAMELCAKLGIKWVGIECDENVLLYKLRQKYALEDICGKWILGDYKYAYRTQGRPESAMSDIIKCAIEYMCNVFDNSSLLAEYDFYEWFERRCRKKFIWGKHLEYAAPTSGKARITNQIGYDWSIIRDCGNMENLLKITAQYNTVCIIMGANHAYADLPALTEAFGSPPVLYPSDKKVSIN
jgi:hypothetical protein